MNPKHKRVLVMLPLLAVAAWLALFGDKTPEDEVAAPTRGGQVDKVAEAAPERSEAPAPQVIMEAAEGEVLRVASRDRARAMIDSSDMRDLFAPSVPPAPPAEQQAAAAAPPPPPVLPFAYIGREQEKSRWRYFLEKNGQVFVLAAGEQAEGFRLEKAGNGELALVELSTQTRHVIAIDGD